jgi:hypothetical protein
MVVSWCISGSRGNGHGAMSTSDSVLTEWISSYLDSGNTLKFKSRESGKINVAYVEGSRHEDDGGFPPLEKVGRKIQRWLLSL